MRQREDNKFPRKCFKKQQFLLFLILLMVKQKAYRSIPGIWASFNIIIHNITGNNARYSLFEIFHIILSKGHLTEWNSSYRILSNHSFAYAPMHSTIYLKEGQL